MDVGIILGRNNRAQKIFHLSPHIFQTPLKLVLGKVVTSGVKLEELVGSSLSLLP